MLLVVNAGSSSLKLAVFGRDLEQISQARAERIGAGGPADHTAALAEGLAAMGVPIAAFQAAAHRVVHGGAGLDRACKVTSASLQTIRDCVPLAPLHNPAALQGIEAISALSPKLPQITCFDTAFHLTNPPVATTYALPLADRQAGIRRYGFHGLSYAGLVRAIHLIGPQAQGRVLALHLGNGSSMCAIVAGRSVATTMGYSPLGGLTMGTRAGEIDGNAVLQLATLHGIDSAGRRLNHESGLLALGGVSDMRALHAAGTAEAAFAIDHFCYWAVRNAGSMIAAMGGLDAIAFTGGIGENDPVIRAQIVSSLAFLGARINPQANKDGMAILHETGSGVAIWTVRAEEERQIASEAFDTLERDGT